MTLDHQRRGPKGKLRARMTTKFLIGCQVVMTHLIGCLYFLGASPYTNGLTAHSNWKFSFANSFGTQHVMNPDPYKGLFGGSQCRDSPVQTQRTCKCQEGSCQASQAYLGQLDEHFQYSLPKGGKVAGFFAESIQVLHFP